MSELSGFTDAEIAEEAKNRHSVKMRFRRACEAVRDSSHEKKMTLYQAADACEYIVKALNLTPKQFADQVLAHQGWGGYFADWNE